MVSVRCRNLAALVLLLGIAQGLAANSLVKQSSSGICHPPQSAHYDRTTHFTGYSSLAECLDADGRLPKGLTLTPGSTDTGYSRSRFGHGWSDDDRDCQDSRAEALVATSTTEVRFADSERCRVVAGRWISPFTGQVVHNAGDMDIDHVVPLAWAWQRGADGWTRARRQTFANDPANLWPVEASLNRSKGAQAPDQWLPPSGQCQYVARFVRLVKRYGLRPTARESAGFQRLLAECR